MVTERRTYEIRYGSGGSIVDRFYTAAGDGRSADERAIGNLADHSDYHDGTFVLYFVDESGETTRTAAIAKATYGLVTELVDYDALAADAMHNGPTIAQVA